MRCSFDRVSCLTTDPLGARYYPLARKLSFLDSKHEPILVPAAREEGAAATAPAPAAKPSSSAKPAKGQAAKDEAAAAAALVAEPVPATLLLGDELLLPSQQSPSAREWVSVSIIDLSRPAVAVARLAEAGGAGGGKASLQERQRALASCLAGQAQQQKALWGTVLSWTPLSALPGALVRRRGRVAFRLPVESKAWGLERLRELESSDVLLTQMDATAVLAEHREREDRRRAKQAWEGDKGALAAATALLSSLRPERALRVMAGAANPRGPGGPTGPSAPRRGPLWILPR